jgi:hypothetical protein
VAEARRGPACQVLSPFDRKIDDRRLPRRGTGGFPPFALVALLVVGSLLSLRLRAPLQSAPQFVCLWAPLSLPGQRREALDSGGGGWGRDWVTGVALDQTKSFSRLQSSSLLISKAKKLKKCSSLPGSPTWIAEGDMGNKI